VGRISAQVDRLHLEYHRDATGFFGLLEAEDDPAVFAALLGAAESWLRSQGMRRVRGPFSLSVNDESGLLVEGFDSPPVFMMAHGRPYYGARVEQQGYVGIQNLRAYRVASEKVPEAPIMKAMRERAAGRVTLRTIRRDHLQEDVAIMRDIFNDAWSGNWGFVPFTEAEFTALGNNIVKIVDTEFVQIAEVDGEPAAMIVLLPNLNEIIKDLNGRLLPFGWLKLLWRMKYAYPRTSRVPLMGVRKQYQRSMLGTALAFIVIDALCQPAIARGVREVEMSWILESNTRMWKIIEALGSECYKLYRLYEKDLY
jgi:hypothetical protein